MALQSQQPEARALAQRVVEHSAAQSAWWAEIDDAVAAAAADRDHAAHIAALEQARNDERTAQSETPAAESSQQPPS